MSDAPAGSRGGLKTFRIILIVALVLLLIVTAYGYLVYLGGADKLRALTRPPIVEVKGQVFWNGRPLPNAILATQPERQGLPAAFGTSDADGNFTLTTHADGQSWEGAVAGKHRVTVTGHKKAPPPKPSYLVTPEIYQNFESTPLTIEVSKDPEDNLQVRLELEGTGPDGSDFVSPDPPGGEMGAAPAIQIPEQTAEDEADAGADAEDADASDEPAPSDESEPTDEP